MPVVDPSVILRLGSHSEKDYFEKVISFIDGYIIAANLVETTPAACASLVFRFSGRRMNTPYLLDPMTYAFGAYHDPQINSIRHDLDWIKSDQKRSKKTIRDFKRSYKSLGEVFGGPFADAVRDRKNENAAISPSALNNNRVIEQVTKAVVSYQRERMPGILRKEMEEDSGAADIIQNFPPPKAIIAPYFYIEPSEYDSWLSVNLRFMQATVATIAELPVHGVLCVDESVLRDKVKLENISKELVKTKINAVWLWFSKLNEDECECAVNGEPAPKCDVSYEKLSRLKDLVKTLSNKMEVYNMHGGFFSLALSKFGMNGISHGVGYGEQKDVVPVIGQAIPVVRYYLPELHRRLGVPDIEHCFPSLKIEEPEDFYSKICDCAICKGVVNKNVSQFRLFGEMQPLKPGKQRSAQTPAAAKRCRFHFLLSRIRERDYIKNAHPNEISEYLLEANKKWSVQHTVQRYCPHLDVWRRALQDSS